MRLLWTIFVLLLPLSICGESIVERENEAVLAYVKKIEKFIEWPTQKALPDGPAQLFVAGLGDSALCNQLKELHGHDLGNGHRVKVRIVSEDMLPANAQVVVVALDKADAAGEIVEKLSGTGTLTIARGAERVGAMLHFAGQETDGKVEIQPEFNAALAEAEGIEAKRALTMLAKVVE